MTTHLSPGRACHEADAGLSPAELSAFARLRLDAVDLLTAWTPPNATQAAVRDSYLAHLHDHELGVAKAGPPAHLTASALVLDSALEQVLLTHHRKAGLWLQFGGHLEPGDASVYAAAVREVAEESGLAGVRVHPVIAQLDRHRLAGSFGTCREHLDVRFAAVVEGGAIPRVSDESHDVRWWPLDGLLEGSRDEVRELAAACRELLNRRP